LAVSSTSSCQALLHLLISSADLVLTPIDMAQSARAGIGTFRTLAATEISCGRANANGLSGHHRPREATMKPFAMATVIVLALFAIAHAARLGLGWSASVNTVDIPMWVSMAALVIAGWLTIGLWREAPRTSAASGINLDQLKALLNVNQDVRLQEALLAPAFPPGLQDAEAKGRFEAFGKEMNCDISLDTRMKTARFIRKQ
jgi:hypothetical protein